MSDNLPVDVVELQKQLESQLRSAIEKLEHSERRDYEEALELVPELVETETKMIDFLRTENWDPVKAAGRLARYWKFRKILFGERCYLPMNQTGKGTLTLEDIEFLRTGFTVVAQRGPNEGILSMADETRMSRWPGFIHSRLIYYFMTVFTDVPSQTKGITILHLIKSGDRPMVDMDKATHNMYNSGLPVRVKQVIVAQAHEFGKDGLLKFLADRTALAIEFKRQHHPVRIESHSVSGTMQQLVSRGCASELIPRHFGGSYDYSGFDEWIRMRISIEDIMGSAPLRYNQLALPTGSAHPTSSLTDQPSGWRTVGPLVKRKSSKEDSAVSNPETEEAYIKKRNAVYSRRLYHRQKLAILSAQGEVDLGKALNARLKAENRRLEHLIAQARKIVDFGGSSATGNGVG